MPVSPIRQADQQAREATLVGKSIPELAARQGLLTALMQEAGATEVDMRAGALNSTLRKMIESIGSLQSVSAAQDSVDKALQEMGTHDPGLAGRYRGEVDAARVFAKMPGTTAEMSSWRYAALQREVLDDMIDSDNDMISRIAGLSSYSGINNGLQTLNTLGTALYNRESEFDVLGAFILGSQLPRTALVANLARASGLYEQASRQLQHAADPQVASAWSTMVNDPDTRKLDALFDQLMTRDSVDPNILIKSSMVETEASTRLVKTTLDIGSQQQAKLAALASSVKDSATSTLRITFLAAMLILAFSFLFALRVTRSIRNPLSDLERGASSVNSGEAQVEAITPSGPRETRTVIASFNDLLANLRLVEAKSQALAELDLTNPALDARLPGRIGSALDASMHALRESVAERTKLAEQLAYDAEHDALTGLANRQLALARLSAGLATHHQPGQQLAVLFIDLDGFKLVNDTHGHGVGDRLLVMVAEQLTALVGTAGIVSRLGGDEFLVLAEDQDAQSAITLGTEIVAAVTRQHTLGAASASASVGASVGIALADGSGSAADLVAQADLALYRAKHDGRGRVQLYDASMQQQLGERADLENALRATLQRGGDELQLHYQSIVDADGRTHAVEALVRWNRAGAGMVAPETFIPLAQSTDLIVELDSWVLAQAAKDAAGWRRDPASADLILFVNVSGRHLLSGELPAHLQQALSASGLEPRSLVLEIAETALPTDAAAVARELTSLRATGVRIALDGFGTGSTSLSMLRTLPLDVLKIDRTLVQNGHDEAGGNVLVVLSNVGHILGLTVIAEGVQTQKQCDTARANGVDLIQGPLVHRPVPGSQLAAAFAAAPHVGSTAGLIRQRPGTDAVLPAQQPDAASR